ncbi:antiviral reverse transcriptase Drt3b [Mameliella sp.]
MREVRAVLTETLPFELPLGFTNENLFLSELRLDQMTDIQKHYLNRLRRPHHNYTKPYLYSINRSRRSRNTLAIIHPAVQLRIANFYSEFEQTIIQSCSRSTFSIRYPYESLRIYSKDSTKDVRKRWELGLPEENVGDSMKTPYTSSYFAYRKYLLLDKFFSSNEIIRLEAKYSKLRMLDISKCFFNIYTHSISWSIKEKDFSKRNAKNYSFEQQFDSLMQHSNYNETAGILVGPEVSRIFAEIILQRVDVELERLVAKRLNLKCGRDYDVRRYVDDFHLFSNDEDVLDKVEYVLAEILEGYKLFLNTGKSEDVERPFVTGISRLKFEVSSICAKLYDELTFDLSADDGSSTETHDTLRKARVSLDALRHIGGTERTLLPSAMSEVFTTLSRIVRALEKMADFDLSDVQSEDLVARVKAVVRILFYLAAIDFRVPPIIRLSLILKEVMKLSKKFSQPYREAITGYLVYELSELMASHYVEEDETVSLEVANTFILGLVVEPNLFGMQDCSSKLLRNILTGKHRCYFSVLCALHALNSVQHIDAESKTFFVDNLIERILTSEFDIEVSCEDYLIFCDTLSCPAIDRDVRWKAFQDKLGGDGLSKPAFDELARCVRHTNWDLSGPGFELVKRRLPPVYFSG